MKLDARKLEALRGALSRLPKRKFDKLLPENKRTPDYVRRMKRKASVAVALANVDGHASVVLTLRSGTVGTHAGQVSFPGGHVEDEETAEQACLRELKEEVGLDANALGRYHETRAVTGTMVTPVVCFIDQPLTRSAIEATSNVSEEVEQAFSIRIEDLAKEESRVMEQLSSRWTMPRFQIPSKSDDEPAEPAHPPIWGLTAFMLDGVMRDILVPVFQLGDYPPSIAREMTTDASL